MQYSPIVLVYPVDVLLLHTTAQCSVKPLRLNISRKVVIYFYKTLHISLIKLWIHLCPIVWSNQLKACVRYFALFLKGKCISSFFRTKYIEKKFNLQLLFLPTVSRTFILSRATTRYPPPWNFLFRKNNCMCNRDNARDVAACPDE